MGSVGSEKWNGMVGGGGDGFKASDASDADAERSEKIARRQPQNQF